MEEQYRKLYESGRSKLRAAGIADADLDARILLEEVCGTNLQTLLVYPERNVTDEQYARYLEFIDRRAAHEPTAMILGKWDFCGLTFRVTHDTLIPEQDTECLVEAALKVVKEKTAGDGASGEAGPVYPETTEDKSPSGLRILDLCTGSGCILLSLLHFIPDAVGTGTDLSEKALEVARENARQLGLDGRVDFLHGDLWEPLEGKVFDLIVSNPPYIPTDVIPTLQPEVSMGEPRMALDGGADGLVFYRRILAEAGRHLSPSGIIILESGFDEASQIREMCEEVGFRDIRIYQDYGGLDRVVLARDRSC